VRLVGLVAVAACAGGTKAGPVAPKEAAVDSQTAQKGAKDLVDEIYEDIGHANTDSLQALLDTKVMVLGPRRTDAVATRADAILALGKYVDAKKKLQPRLKSAALGVFPSEGGHSAWGYDHLDANGEQWAAMVVMSGSNDLWSVDAVALGETPPLAKVKAELKKDAVVPPAAGVTVKADPSAAAAVEKFTKGLADQHAWATELEGNELAVVIGPSAGEVTHGKKDMKALWKKRFKANVRAVLAGEVSGAATRDGMLAWVSAPIMRAEEGEEPLPLRAFAVFARAGGAWTMIALQESVALDAPGAGVPFKKFVPPAVAPPPPPPDDKKVDKTADKKAKKKKKPGADEDEVAPKKVVKKKKAAPEDDPPPEEKPKKKKKPVEDAGADDKPKKRRGFGGADADDGDVPKKRTKKKAADDDAVTVDDDAPKKKAAESDDDDAPKKKKKKKPADDDDVKISD